MEEEVELLRTIQHVVPYKFRLIQRNNTRMEQVLLVTSQPILVFARPMPSSVTNTEQRNLGRFA